MKLKTKFQDEDFNKGEVVEANLCHGGNNRFKVIAEPPRGGIITFYYDSIKEFSDMWEDVPEKPKQAIENIWTGNRREKTIHIKCDTEKHAKELYNKLRAWQRLQEKGFKFLNWSPVIDDPIFMDKDKEQLIIRAVVDYGSRGDLTLLFSGFLFGD